MAKYKAKRERVCERERGRKRQIERKRYKIYINIVAQFIGKRLIQGMLFATKSDAFLTFDYFSTTNELRKSESADTYGTYHTDLKLNPFYLLARLLSNQKLNRTIA